VANQTVYVKPGGGLTLTKPTGSNLIQNIAKVGKISGGNAGSLVISSILRTNDVPNLTTGKIWVGTAANTAESGVVYLDEGNGRMGIGTTTPATKLDVVGDSEFNGEVRISSNNIHVNDKLLNIVDGGTGKEGIHIRTGQPTIDFQDWNTGGKGEITSDDGNISIQADVANTKASSNITFLVDASERMRITDTGNVGIGTTSPSRELTVGDGTTDARIRTYYSDGSYTETWGGGIVFNRSASYLRPDGDNTKTLYIGSDIYTWQNLNLYAETTRFTTEANGEAMRITSTGNVGIGTTSPTFKLNVNSGTDNTVARFASTDGTATIVVADNAGSAYFSRLNNKIQIGGTSGDSALNLTVLDTGNVGIGTTNPTHRLYVQGNNGPLLVTREITTPNQARIGIGETNPSTALDFGSYSDGIISGTASLRFSNGSKISELGTTRLAFQADAGYFFYPTTATPSADVYGVDIRHLRDSAVNTTDAVLEVNNSANSSLMIVRSDGNVGIGTTSPSALLDVEGRVDFASDIRLRGQSASLNIGVVRLYVDATNNFFIDPGNAGTALSTFKSTGAIQLGNYGSGTFTGTATQRLAVDSSGNVIEIPIGSGPVDGSGTANYVTFNRRDIFCVFR
jgi:hypothetical protein